MVFLSIFLGGIASLWTDLPAITHGGFLHVLRLRKLGNVVFPPSKNSSTIS